MGTENKLMVARGEGIWGSGGKGGSGLESTNLELSPRGVKYSIGNN